MAIVEFPLSTIRPPILYGTAWKEGATEALVATALEVGYRAIDTANQRKHYYEEGVGRALAAAFASGSLMREDIFLQTKFTFEGGQDHRLPYDPNAPIREQVQQSFQLSLDHLGVGFLDSLILHGPSQQTGLGSKDEEAWLAMEQLVAEGGAKAIGISNVNAGQLELLLKLSTVKPAFVQNRCYARLGWDAEVRAICEGHGVVYQGFSLLTANTRVVSHRLLQAIAAERGCTPAQAVFSFARRIGILPLVGTTRAEHMRDDLIALELKLNDEQARRIWEAST